MENQLFMNHGLIFDNLAIFGDSGKRIPVDGLNRCLAPRKSKLGGCR